MIEPRIPLRSTSEVISEGERSALAAIYCRAIERYEEQKKGGPETAPDDAMKGSSDDRARSQFTK